jgi:maltose O-acetyltransferase
MAASSWTATGLPSGAKCGPRVQIYTATHPLDAATRRPKLEFALPVVIEDAGKVAGNDAACANNVLAVANPCRVLRTL